MENKLMLRFAAVTAIFLGHSWILAKGQTATYSITDLGTLGGATSTACGINDRGQVAGNSAIASGELHAFLWDGGTMTDLGTLPGRAFSGARFINNRGQVVGSSSPG